MREADAIAAAERDKYDHVWALAAYRVKAHGLWLWQTHRAVFPPLVRSALDIGCGHGRLMARWLEEGVDAYGVDISETALDPEIRAAHGARVLIAPLWDMKWRRRFDVGVCADVMEHVPEAMVPETLRRIADCCDLVLFKIANFPSRSLGFDLHPTMRDAGWWQARLAEAGGEVERLAIPTDRVEYYFRWRPCT